MSRKSLYSELALYCATRELPMPPTDLPAEKLFDSIDAARRAARGETADSPELDVWHPFDRETARELIVLN